MRQSHYMSNENFQKELNLAVNEVHVLKICFQLLFLFWEWEVDFRFGFSGFIYYNIQK